jgi:hypothetical protein
MTKRQRKYWEKKMHEQEERLLNYYVPNLRDSSWKDHDGSFVMSAFLRGYWTAQRNAQKGVSRGR